MLRRRGFSLVCWWLSARDRPSDVRAALVRRLLTRQTDDEFQFETLVDIADFNELFPSVSIPAPIGGIIVDVDESLHEKLAALDRAHDPDRYRQRRAS